MGVKKKLIIKEKKESASNRKKNLNKKHKKRFYRRFQYTEEALKECIDKVKTRELSICRASQEYKVPKATLINKLAKNENTLGKLGPPPILSQEEENMIVTWIIEKAKIDYPMHRNLVKSAVQNILKKTKRPNPFTNDLPGNKWFSLFLKRHPIISLKHYEVISKSRAAVTEEAIREWFSGLKKYLEEEKEDDILFDPSRIFNTDEIGVPLCPRTGKLLGETKEKNNYYISPGQDKENITVLPSYSADGKLIRPMIVYPYKRFPPKVVAASVPAGYVIGHSPSGYMTSDTFSQFIKNGFYPQLVTENVKFPVLLLFDGHRSHISMQLHEFCKDHGIILYLLYPNSTHILQPCDVAIFKPLKVAWRQVVSQHSQNSTTAITKSNFAPLFNQAMIQASDPAVIKKAFECCGLYPFNADAVNYTKCISTRRKAMKNRKINSSVNSNGIIDNSASSTCVDALPSTSTSTPTTSSINSLHLIETNIPKDILSIFSTAYKTNEIPHKEVVLFNLWKNIKESVENNRDGEVGIKNPNNLTDLFNERINDENLIEVVDYNNLEGNWNQDDKISKYSHEKISLDFNEIPIILVDDISSTFDSTTVGVVDEFTNLSMSAVPEDLDKEKFISTGDISSNLSDTEQVIEAVPCTEITSSVLKDSEVHCTSSMNGQDSVLYNYSMNEPIPNMKLPSVYSSNTVQYLLPMDLSMNYKDSLPVPFVEKDSFKKQCQDSDSSKWNQEIPCVSADPSNLQDIVKMELDCNENESPSSSNLKELWKQELHFPEIVKSKKKMTQKPTIFAITSEAFKKEQEEKNSKQIELEKVKKLKKFEREMKKKIKQKEIEMKKQEKIKLREQVKLQEQSIKNETEATLRKLMKEMAESLEINNLDTIISVPKKRKVMKDISNVEL